LQSNNFHPLKRIATVLSFLFHPVFVPFAISMCMMVLCPAMFASVDAKTLGLWKIQIGLNTILYPLLVTFLLWRLKFIDNLYMRTNQERLGTLIACILFYFWNYYVFHKSYASEAPIVFKSFLLATFISVCILFLTTIFTKMSMHTTALSGACAGLFLFAIKSNCPNWIPFSAACVALISIIWSRLYLKEHTKAEVVSGIGIGIVSQAIGWWFYQL
jgi:membrane-associated phospholipid phosphatase